MLPLTARWGDATGVDAWQTLLLEQKDNDGLPGYHLIEKYSTDVLGVAASEFYPAGGPA
jgi:hypothetical protein